MLAQMIKSTLGLALLVLCFMLGACDNCVKYQDIAGVEIGSDIDSVAMIVNESIVGCRGLVGSKTHRIKFPVNMHFQLFSEGDLWKELSFEMDRNTVLVVYRGGECSAPVSSSSVMFYARMESAKKSNRYIDSYSADDFCWLLEKIDDFYYDNRRCIEWSSGGKTDLCE